MEKKMGLLRLQQRNYPAATINANSKISSDVTANQQPKRGGGNGKLGGENGSVTTEKQKQKQKHRKQPAQTQQQQKQQQQQAELSVKHQQPPIQQKHDQRTVPPPKSSLLIKQMQQQQQQIHPSPSLVRRARVIRRRTTSIYCDALRKLRSEDAVLANQILIIRLKPRCEALDYKCSSNPRGDPQQLVPSVDFAYPPMGSNACNYPPQLFYPDFLKSTVQCREDGEFYQVVLTNAKAERTFAFCFKFLTNPPHSSLGSIDSGIGVGNNGGKIASLYSVLVFVSPYPQESLPQNFHELAADFVHVLQKEGDASSSSRLMPLCKDLIQLRLTTSELSVRLSKYVLATDCGDADDGGGRKAAATQPSSTQQQQQHWSRCHVSTMLERVGVENAVLVFLSLLAENRVIVTGSNVSEVSKTVQALVRLLAPLEWPHTLVPIVPDCQMDLCSNPTPYICGVLRYNLSRIAELICPRENPMGEPDYALNEGITVVDVDRGMIVPAAVVSRPDKRIGLSALLHQTSLMGFPRAAVCDLLNLLKACLPVRNAEKADYKIEKRVMIWYAKLFGHFRKFDGLEVLTARNRKMFASAHPCAETQLFLKWFVENGILQYFLSCQQSESSASSVSGGGGGGLPIRFQKILKKYAPPMGQMGKRRRTKSLIWKVFTR